MEKKTHYFYALSIPNKAKIILNEQCKKLKESLPFNRWVHYEDYHITLAFLGYAPEDQLRTSVELVKKGVSDLRSFFLDIHQLGAFGKGDSPRIFWAGVKRENGLFQVRDRVYHACTSAGFMLETRSFSPHITIARKWIGDKPFEKQILENNPCGEFPIRFLGSEVVLYRTHLDRTPKYEVVESFSLRDCFNS